MKTKHVLLSALLAVSTAAASFAFPAKSEDAIKVKVNGQTLAFDQQPIIENDRVLVPVRALFEALGAEVNWDNETRQVTASKDGIEISMTIGNSAMEQNGRTIRLDAPPKIVNDRTLVPLRAVSECFGALVIWNSNDCSVTIYPLGKPPVATPSPSSTPKPTAAPQPTNTPAHTQAPQPTETPAPTNAPQPTEIPKPTVTPAPTATPTPTNPPEQESSFERQVFELVNQERAKQGLNALTWNDDLAAVARAHSKDMHDRQFMDHTNPDGLSPFDRMKNYGIKYTRAAENIAAGQRTPQAVMNSWMNSSGHRANILNPNLKSLGVGYYEGTKGYQSYWTQCFMAP